MRGISPRTGITTLNTSGTVELEIETDINQIFIYGNKAGVFNVDSQSRETWIDLDGTRTDYSNGRYQNSGKDLFEKDDK